MQVSVIRPDNLQINKEAPKNNSVKNDIDLNRFIKAPVNLSQPVSVMLDGVPIEIIEYFNQDIRSLTQSDKRQLREIYDIYKNGSDDMGDVLLRIARADRKIGAPSGRDSRWGKLWAYARLSTRFNNRKDTVGKQIKAFENS